MSMTMRVKESFMLGIVKVVALAELGNSTLRERATRAHGGDHKSLLLE